MLVSYRKSHARGRRENDQCLLHDTTLATHLHHRSRAAIEKLSIQVDCKPVARKRARARYVAGTGQTPLVSERARREPADGPAVVMRAPRLPHDDKLVRDAWKEHGRCTYVHEHNTFLTWEKLSRVRDGESRSQRAETPGYGAALQGRAGADHKSFCRRNVVR